MSAQSGAPFGHFRKTAPSKGPRSYYWLESWTLTNQRPDVDVGVVTWNTADVTPKALRALLDSEQGCRIRLLVRDNASSDGTVEAIRATVPEAEIDAGTRNLGFGAGMNTIFARSSAPWLLVLNPDAWPSPNAIGRLVEAAERHPRAAAIAPRLENADGTLQHSTHPFPSISVAANVAFRWGRLPPEKADALMLEGSWAHDREREVDWAIAASMLLRHSALERIGGFDETFFMYVEDLEWCWRARTLGWEIWFEPSAVFQHVGNVSGQKAYGDKRRRTFFLNELIFYRRTHGRAAALAWWAVNLAGSGVRMASAIGKRDRAQARHWRSYARDLVAARIDGRRKAPD